MPDPIKPVEPNNDDTFAAAFAQIAELDNPPAAPAEPAAAVVPAAAATTTETAPAAPVEPAAPEALPTAEEVAAQATASAAAPAAPVVDDTAQDNELLRRLGSLLQKAPATTQAPSAPVREEPPAVFTPDEIEFLTAYEKDFPDVARAEALQRRGEYQAVVGYIFQEVTREFRPLVDMVRTLSERTHLGDLQTAVPDYATTRQQVIDWAAKQPAYLQPAYNHVIQQGTVDEVADLIKRYRTDTGTAVPAAAAAPAVPAAPAALPPAVARAAAALAPVTSKRTAASVAAEPADFDGAFAAALAIADKL